MNRVRNLQQRGGRNQYVCTGERCVVKSSACDGLPILSSKKQFSYVIDIVDDYMYTTGIQYSNASKRFVKKNSHKSPAVVLRYLGGCENKAEVVLFKLDASGSFDTFAMYIIHENGSISLPGTRDSDDSKSSQIAERVLGNIKKTSAPITVISGDFVRDISDSLQEFIKQNNIQSTAVFRYNGTDYKLSDFIGQGKIYPNVVTHDKHLNNLYRPQINKN